MLDEARNGKDNTELDIYKNSDRTITQRLNCSLRARVLLIFMDR